MIHTIENTRLSVSVDETGAQLMSVRGKDGAEYLWQGDPKYWADRALTIFPFVARLPKEQYRMDGKQYSMPIHGFAPESEFCPVRLSKSGMEMVLESNEKTYSMYPRKFVFTVRYELEENTLKVTYLVENRDEREMYFGLGGHPGINVPLTKGKRFEDYRLRFGEPASPNRILFSNKLVSGKEEAYPLENGTVIRLDHAIFDDGAIVLRDMAKEVTLECPGDEKYVTVRYPQMDYLGFWQWERREAPYLCIEPWSSLPAMDGKEAVFEEMPGLIHLKPGKTYRNQWSMEIH